MNVCSVFIHISKSVSKNIYYLRKVLHTSTVSMELVLVPPKTVKGMTELQKEVFTKKITVPTVRVHKDSLNKVLKHMKMYLLKLKDFNPVVNAENKDFRQLILDPEKIKSDDSAKNYLTAVLQETDLSNLCTISETVIAIEYKHWTTKQILRAVLPDNLDICSAYSQIGHLLHLNLREGYYPYKYLIGQVFLEKVPNIRTVVNKTDIVDSSDDTFRTFSMEVLAGDKSSNGMIVTVKENQCSFTFDFSKVYWNPRLCSEHERIVNKLGIGDVLYDVMAGVGPFSIPAAKKGCIVLANDLNPHSYSALKENSLINKVSDRLRIFNIDGKEFIRSHLKDDMISKLNDPEFIKNIHVAMNLPSRSLDFLPEYIGLLFDTKLESLPDNKNTLPTVHIYFFSHNESREFAVHLVASKLGYCIENIEFGDEVQNINTETLRNNIKSSFWQYILEVVVVRKVAPAKVMMRVSFILPLEVLTCNPDSCSSEIQPYKKLKV